MDGNDVLAILVYTYAIGDSCCIIVLTAISRRGTSIIIFFFNDKGYV